MLIKFNEFSKLNIIKKYSRNKSLGAVFAERFTRTIRNLLKKPVFLKGNAEWLSELPSVFKQYNITMHHSLKRTPIDASIKSNEKEVYSNLQDNREKQKPVYNLGHLVRTVDNKRVFSKGDSTNWSYKLYTITQLIHNTIPSYRFYFLPERYNENFSRLTNLTLDENNQNMKKPNLIL